MMVILIVHRSVGNDSVGSAWHEIYEYADDTSLSQVIADLGGTQEDIIIPARRYKQPEQK